jgi:hypothetical protein
MTTGWMLGRRLFRAVAAVVLAVFVAGCTTTRTIDVATARALVEEVEPGDRVAITTHDGRELAFEVVRVEPDALVGAAERAERNEIARLDVTRPDELRTAGAVGGGTLAVLVAIGIVAAAVLPAAILSASP